MEFNIRIYPRETELQMTPCVSEWNQMMELSADNLWTFGLHGSMTLLSAD